MSEGRKICHAAVGFLCDAQQCTLRECQHIFHFLRDIGVIALSAY